MGWVSTKRAQAACAAKYTHAGLTDVSIALTPNEGPPLTHHRGPSTECSPSLHAPHICLHPSFAYSPLLRTVHNLTSAATHVTINQLCTLCTSNPTLQVMLRVPE
eukprot:87411-Pelagomonas_calceolata.AAC.5